MSTIHNLMVNPVPVSTAGWLRFGDVEYRPTEDNRGIYVRNAVGGASKGIEYGLPSLPAGDYMYGFYASCPDHVNGDQLSLIKSATGENYLCDVRRTQKDGFYTASVALTEPGCKILFVAPKTSSGEMSMNSLILTPASEWPTVQALCESGGLPNPYFSGESLP